MTKKKTWKDNDPKAKREAQRYEHPVPSREHILSTMDAFNAPLDADQLHKLLGLKTQRDKGAVSNRLKAMVRDGQILRNRRGDFCLVARIPVLTGQVMAHRDGFGFVRVPTQDEDIYLSPRQMMSVFHGDRIAVRVTGHDRRGRPEGRVVEVLARRSEEFAGRYIREGGVGFVIPENPRITHHLLIPKGKALSAKPGQMVVAKLVQMPSNEHHAIAHIIEVLGEVTQPGLETDMAIRTYGLPFEFPEEVVEQTAGFSARVTKKAKEGRLDLRKLPLVTIDGSDARDFDDAVYAEPLKDGGHRLIVAIADVAHYVESESPLDLEAIQRGTSVYFPNRVIPMLPEALSNGLCSLKPQVDRLCLICDMHISAQGKVTKSSFAKAVMHSAARLTYNEVHNIIWEKDPALRKKRKRLIPHLEHLKAVYESLSRARERRGSIELDLPQSRFEFDEEGSVEAVVRYPRNHAHRLIEECMVTANVEAARFLKRNKMPALYRNHPPPEEDRVEKLASFLQTVGMSLPRKESVTPKDFKKVAAEISSRPDSAALSMTLLRAMMQAVYEPKCDGHFGLALKEYAHFTSPIRRYPDLLVHRAIAHALTGGKPKTYRYKLPEMEDLGQQCSMTERRAEEASRDVEKWLKCEYMLDKVGEHFEGTVVAVTEFGLFVEISELLVDGLVHVTALGNDYYTFDNARHQLVGRRSGDRYSLGQTVTIRVAGVSMEDRKIDFDMQTSDEHRKKSSTRYKDKRKGGGGKKTSRRGKASNTKSKSKPKPKSKSQSKNKSKNKNKAQPKTGQAKKSKSRRK
ncbi:MAG: ribonuclease R [Gammaproteobacteria bacterium]